MIVRKIRCPSCAAPREALEDAAVLFCEHCGAFSSMDTGVYYRGNALADLHEKQVREMLDNSSGRSRTVVLSEKMSKAAAAGDRAAWHAAAGELFAIQGMLDPRMIPVRNSRPMPFEEWHREAVEMAGFLAFDPEAKKAMSGYSAALGGVGPGKDPVEWAGGVLEAAREYQAAISVLPDCPDSARGTGSGHIAMEMARAAVNAMESMLGPKAVRRIRIEVLGDKLEAPALTGVCGSCGARLDGPDPGSRNVKCPYCGSVVQAEEDPWIENQLAIWEITRRDLSKRGALNGPEGTIAAVASSMSPLWMGNSIEPETALEFLKRAVPGASKRDLASGVATYRSAFEKGDPKSRFLEGLAALIEHGGWKEGDRDT